MMAMKTSARVRRFDHDNITRVSSTSRRAFNPGHTILFSDDGGRNATPCTKESLHDVVEEVIDEKLRLVINRRLNASKSRRLIDQPWVVRDASHDTSYQTSSHGNAASQ